MTGRNAIDIETANRIHWNASAVWWRALGLPEVDKARELAANLRCPSGSNILDAGCGAGLWSAALARQGYQVDGIDLSPEMISEARELAEQSGLGMPAVRFQVAGVERTPFQDGYFDGIICRAVLDFTASPGLALAELQRVLKPGGHVVLVTLGAYSPAKRDGWQAYLPRSDVAGIANHILPWEVEALLAAMEWEIIAQEGFYGPSASGQENKYTAEMSARLADRVLQQTIATAWQFVARGPAAIAAHEKSF